MEKVNHLEEKIKFEIEEGNKSFKNSLGNLMKLIQMKEQFEGLIISSYLKSGGFDLFYPGILQLNTKKGYCRIIQTIKFTLRCFNPT